MGKEPRERDEVAREEGRWRTKALISEPLFRAKELEKEPYCKENVNPSYVELSSADLKPGVPSKP